MLPAGNNCFGTRATSHCHPLSRHPTANCQLPLPTPTSHSHPLDLAHIVTRKSCSTAKYINGEAFKICATFALRCFNFWHLRGANSTTSKSGFPDRNWWQTPGQRSSHLPAGHPEEAMNSFICLLVQVATSFCKHFRLHTTFGPTTKKKLAEIKPAPKTG